MVDKMIAFERLGAGTLDDLDNNDTNIALAHLFCCVGWEQRKLRSMDLDSKSNRNL